MEISICKDVSLLCPEEGDDSFLDTLTGGDDKDLHQ